VAGGASIVVPQIAKVFNFLGQKTASQLIRASDRDVKNGFQIGNVFKYQLGGTLQQTLEKSTAKLTDLSQQLRALLTRPGASGNVPKVDVWGAFQKTIQELRGNSASTFGTNASIQRAIETLQKEPHWMKLQHGLADLAEANEIKQGVGHLGAWNYGQRDLDAATFEKVANVFYTHLRESIEQAAASTGPSNLRSINRQMGEIMAIRDAVIRRMPIADRQNLVSLGDKIGLSAGSWTLVALNQLWKSGQAANQMVKAGERIAEGSSAVGWTGAAATPGLQQSPPPDQSGTWLWNGKSWVKR
jgi:hypothetical protein